MQHGWDDEERDGEVEALLRRGRAEPSRAVVDRLERRLLGRPRASSRRRRAGPLVVAAASTGTLALAVIAAGLSGGGPLGPSREVRARDTCRFVTVPTRQRQVVVVRDQSGQPTLAVRWRTVQRRVERCG